MTETKLDNGKVCGNGLGLPKTLDGLDAVMQRAYNRLNIVRGSFRYDRELGNRMLGEAALTEEIALRFAQEALLPCPEIAVIRAEIREDAVTVLLSTPLGEGSVTVYLKEEDESDI